MKKQFAKWTSALTAVATLMLVAPTLASAQETETLQIDPVHSNVLFRANHMGIGYVFGEFLEFDGTLEYSEEEPSASSIEFAVQADSIETHNEKRNNHLKGPDFLNAKKHGELTFESNEVEKVDDETWEVSGDLTIRGETKPITIDVKELGEGKGPEGNFRRGFYSEFDIERTEFGVDWNPDVVQEPLRLILAFEFVKQDGGGE